MTEYEYVDTISSYATQGGTFFTIWVTFLSAYALVAYFAGDQLKKSQILWLNCLYIFASSLSIFGFFGSFRSQVHYIHQLKQVIPNSPQIMNIYVAYGVSTFAVLGILATLKFMWDIRHPNPE